MKESDSLSRTIFYYLTGLLILLILNAILIKFSRDELEKTNNFFHAIQIAKTNIDALQSDVIRGIDTGLRGYAITGKMDMLNPHLDAPKYFNQIKSTIHDQMKILGYDQEVSDHLFSSVDAYITYSNGLRVLLDTAGMGAFSTELAKDRGMQTWNDYHRERKMFAEMLQTDIAAMNEKNNNIQLGILVVQLVSFVLSIVLFVLIYRRIKHFSKAKNEYIYQIQESNNALKKLQEVLETEVQRKTKDLALSNRELEEVIDDMKRMQSQMLQSEKMASLGIMTSGISHEFNNALNYVKGGSQILMDWVQKSDTKATDVEPTKNVISKGIERIEKIVKSLQMFSLQGEKQLYQPIFLQEVIDSALALLVPKINGVKVHLKLEMKDALMLNRTNIQHVLIQLLDNAIDAVDSLEIEDRLIEIETARFDDMVIIKVINKGKKINLNQLSNIFDPFFTTKDPGKGTGLGLSICYAIIKDHKGNIYAKNNNDRVEFVIELPMITA